MTESTESDVQAKSIVATGGIWRVSLLLGLLFCFSPTLIDLFGHLGNRPWTLTTLIVPWLVWVAHRVERTGQPVATVGEARGGANRLGWVVLGVGLVIQLMSIAGGIVRVGRVALVLSLIGACRAMDLLSLRTVLLLVWLVPVPYFVVHAASPGLEALWTSIGAGVATFVGFEVELVESQLIASRGPLVLQPLDGGILLAATMAGLGWFSSLVRRESFLAGVGRAALFAGVGLPIQGIAVCLTALALGAGADPAWLMHALSWFPVVLISSLGSLMGISALRCAREGVST